jgi:HD superfamily phosphohydrolase
MQRFVIRDAVHGDVYLTADEGRLLDTREMQRLRNVRQLGLAHLVFPGARHSRFEHSIGTLHMSQVLIDAVRRNAEFDPESCRSIDEHEARIVRAAALVHDVTHIPFGHNIEDQTGLLPRHDRPERFEAMLNTDGELGAELERQGLLNDILGVLGARSSMLPPFIAQMISDTICSDLMDYLRRDAYFTGLDLRYDLRIADYFRIDPHLERLYIDCQKEGLLREDIVSEVMRMLQARYFFSERVYYHHAKIAAGAMIARVVETALLSGWLEPSDLFGMTDEGMLLRLERIATELSGEEARRVRELLDRLGSRRLIKRVAVFPYSMNREMQGDFVINFFAPSNQETRRNWEREREAEFEKKFGRKEQVLLYCPNRKMQLKEIDTFVRHPSAEGLQPLSSFKEEHPGLQELEDAYLRLWKVYVLTTATDREERQYLQECACAALAGAQNAYRL